MVYRGPQIGVPYSLSDECRVGTLRQPRCYSAMPQVMLVQRGRAPHASRLPGSHAGMTPRARS